MGFYFLEIILYTNISLSDWKMICGFKKQKISHLNLLLSPSNHQNCSICLRGLDDVSCTRGFHDWCSCITFISFGQEGSSPPIEFIREDCLRNLSRNDLVTPHPPHCSSPCGPCLLTLSLLPWGSRLENPAIILDASSLSPVPPFAHHIPSRLPVPSNLSPHCSSPQEFPWALRPQHWFPLGWSNLILQSKGLSRVFSSTPVQKHQFFGAQLSL